MYHLDSFHFTGHWKLPFLLTNLLSTVQLRTFQKKEYTLHFFQRQLKGHYGLRRKYISDLLLCYEPSRPLRSSGTGLLSAPRVKTEHGQAAFSYYAPHMWRKLPREVHVHSNSHLYKSRLKAFLFAIDFCKSNFKVLNNILTCTLTFIVLSLFNLFNFSSFLQLSTFNVLFLDVVLIYFNVFQCNFMRL